MYLAFNRAPGMLRKDSNRTDGPAVATNDAKSFDNAAAAAVCDDASCICKATFVVTDCSILVAKISKHTHREKHKADHRSISKKHSENSMF